MTFLPEIRSWSKQKDRKKKILGTLFPGYVFTGASSLDNEKINYFKNNRAVRILGNKEKSEPIPVPDNLFALF
jgi:hypothetical protein